MVNLLSSLVVIVANVVLVPLKRHASVPSGEESDAMQVDIVKGANIASANAAKANTSIDGTETDTTLSSPPARKRTKAAKNRV